MFSNTPIAHLILHNPPLPPRHWKRGVSILTLYNEQAAAIINNRDLAKNNKAAKAELLHLTLLYMGAHINSVLEEALISRLPLTDDKSDVNSIPIPMEKLHDLLDYGILDDILDVEKAVQEGKTFLSNKTYAFDTLIYNKVSKKLLWLHMAYGLAESPKFIKSWKEQSENSALLIQRLVEQLYGKVINCMEIVYIDPLLEQSRKDIAIWSLEDADQITGVIGTADRIEACREEMLYGLNMQFNSFSDRHDENLQQQLNAELRSIAYTAHQTEPDTEIKVLVPQ